MSKQIRREPFIKTFFKSQDITSKAPLTSIGPEEVTLGGMPTVCLRQIRDPGIWFKGYEQTHLERDVRELSRVGDLLTLRALLRLAALRTGQLLVLSQLGRAAKLNTVTTSRYISLFEASFIIERVPPYLGNRSSRLIKSPKLYFSDTGLVSHLIGMDPTAAAKNDPLLGALYETYASPQPRSWIASCSNSLNRYPSSAPMTKRPLKPSLRA